MHFLSVTFINMASLRWAGAGRCRGADGMERWLRFLAPMTVCLLSGSRRVPPFGLAGGEPGQVGENAIHGRKAPGNRCPVRPGEMNAGDLLRIATPGGGGFGVGEELSQEASCLSINS
jgi:5-oxoprolinase (ATP-hydrolysing)